MKHLVSALSVLCFLAACATTKPSQVAPSAQPVAATSVNSAVIPAPRTDPWILERQAECVRRAAEAPQANVVFLGDSITQGWEDGGAEAWRNTLQPLGALNLGVSGDRTENVLWRLQQAPITRLQPKCVVLLIGTNNLGHGTHTGEQALAGVLEVIRTLRAQAPAAMLLVLDVFPRGERFNPMRGELAQLNQALRAQAATLGYVSVAIGDRWVRADGSLDPADMPDFLHLSPRAYAAWADALAPHLQGALR